MQEHYYDDQNDEDDRSHSSYDCEESKDEYDETCDDYNMPMKPTNGDLKQHVVAVTIAVIAAVTTHAQIHGGFESWKNQLMNDWDALRSSFAGKRTDSSTRTGVPRAAPNGGAPHAAPVMNAIPADLRQKAVQKAVQDIAAAEDSSLAIGHARASAFRRTADLKFCYTDAFDSSQKAKNLVDLDFIIPLEPSVAVLHSYYLSDALGLDSSFVYDSVDTFGSFDSDIILKKIGAAIEEYEGEGLSTQRVRLIIESYVDSDLVDDEHVCLLQQYAANKRSGRSIRGRTKAYDQPHVSSFYDNNVVSTAVSSSREASDMMTPASLTFTGFATKFINLGAQPVNLYWDGGHISSGPKAGQIHTALVGAIPIMESIGTASFPGHSFFVTPSYDKDHVLRRWTVTEDDIVLYYDPLENLSTEDQETEIQKLCDSGKLNLKQKFARDAWIVDRSFSRDYLVKTGRHYLSVFPQPLVPEVVQEIASSSDEGMMPMWGADFLGQVHSIETSELYFTAIPNALPKLSRDDFLPDVEQQRCLEMKKYRSSQVKGNGNISNSTMQLDIKVVSCAPRVLEVKRFLSPVEVQHLIDLASGSKGDVSMQSSTVMASGINDKKVRSSTKQVNRSSTGGWIHREQDALVDGIFRRVADLLGVDERMMRDQRPAHLIGTDDYESLPTHDRIVEAMQLLRYEPGEHYSAHHDFTYPSVFHRYQPKRYATVLLYLTGEGDVIENGIRRSRSKKSAADGESEDGLAGGETTFPRAITTEFHDGVKVKPQSGKAILFYNVLPDGNMDDLSQHAGEKVEAGVKYVANIWVWDPIIS
jgi:prolyl 4-hydroxylase